MKTLTLFCVCIAAALACSVGHHHPRIAAVMAICTVINGMIWMGFSERAE